MNDLKTILLETCMFEDNTYLDKYVNLINNNRDTIKEKFLTQEHHILPRCYFDYIGAACDDSSNNLVTLKIADHILAHYYLANACCELKLKHGLSTAVMLITNTHPCTISEEDLNAENYAKHIAETLRLRSELYTGREGYNKDKTIITNGINEKIVSPEEVEYYVSQGWTHGRLPFTDEDKDKKSEAQKNRRVMNNGEVTVRVKEENIDSYIEEGFVFGMSSSSKEGLINYYKENPVPKDYYKWIFDGQQYTRVGVDKLEEYLDKGWIQKGPDISEEHKKSIGEKNKKNHTGRVHVHNDNEHYMVKPEEVESYVSRGFKIGSGVSSVQPPSVWMNKDGKNARVHPEEEDKYLSMGWSRGMLKGAKLKK